MTDVSDSRVKLEQAVCTCQPQVTERSAAEISDDELVAMAKALGHPARLRIMRVLASRTTCITGDLVAELNLAQSTISEHLRILREAGLIQGEIEGPRTSYCINRSNLNALRLGVDSI